MADEMRRTLGCAVEHGASDIFVISGQPLSMKLGGVIKPVGEEKLRPELTERLVRELYALAERRLDRFLETGDDDFSLSVSGLSRFRVSAYRQRNSMAAVIRVVSFGIPTPEEMGIPEAVMRVAERTKGLVLVTGPAGGGKSTTLACLIDRINASRNAHIITLEDPIEYVHRNKRSVVSQREIASDTESYLTALRASLRQAPDVILLGEMRDYETIKTAMTAAETGHLVLSTLHTLGAANTIDRIIDVFPANQQQQIRVQLAMLLQSVISQQLLPTVNGGRAPAFEILHLNPAVRNMVREAKLHQLDTVIYASQGEGMVTMDMSILALLRAGKITRETAVQYALNPDQMEKKIQSGLK